MKKDKKFLYILIVILSFSTLFFSFKYYNYKNNQYLKNENCFINYYEIMNAKLLEKSTTIEINDFYSSLEFTLEDIFYSKKFDECLYSYKVETVTISEKEISEEMRYGIQRIRSDSPHQTFSKNEKYQYEQAVKKLKNDD